ncbi:membrane protein insertion efficiency factor YidD [candidate division WOR-3 bacterium]|nr:membrane protein insertion efficiency factor YidD [candidate division WOR-3 bacterium]
MSTCLLLVVLTTAPHETNPINIVLQTGITFYQKVISTSQADACNFFPSCSHFAQRAVERYGFFWGTLMASDRLMRCNPSAFHHFNTFYSGLHEHYVCDPAENNYIFTPIQKQDTMIKSTLFNHDTP